MKNSTLLWILASGLLLSACSDDSTGKNGNTGDVPGPGPVPQSECGNLIVESGETCDDGNQNAGDGCAADCKSSEPGYRCPPSGGACRKNSQPVPVSKCGNRILDEGEACDDGNQIADDGCAADCSAIDNGYTCPRVGRSCVPESCGNGVVEKNEECDYGPESNVEYSKYDLSICAPDCQWAHFCGDGKLDRVDIEHGETCDTKGIDTSNERNGCSVDCKRVNYCGDGVIQADAGEACDDGNERSNDGCSSDCQFEEGFRCYLELGKTVCHSISCGNGVFEPDMAESCDDGNRESGDGCSASCSSEKGYRCTTNSAGKSECVFTCGDGILDEESGETCDDHNLTSGDGCSVSCTVEPGWMCPDAGKPCVARACGDGVLAGSEECDDGNLVNDDGCSARCKLETGYRCLVVKNGRTLCCYNYSTEQQSPVKADECLNEHPPKGFCGNHIVETGEECDTTNSGCNADCTLKPGWECQKDVYNGSCRTYDCGTTAGNISVDPAYNSSKQCDDGNLSNNDGCSASCRLEEGYHCSVNGGVYRCVKGRCNDGFLDAGEECDDGNAKPNDGCSPSCRRETMFDSYVDENGVASYYPRCGDGITLWMIPERDDLGNPVCKSEAFKDAAAPYSDAVANSKYYGCKYGFVPAEECDDGNLVSGDGCSTLCKTERGFECTDFGANPKYVDMDITYYDFRAPQSQTSAPAPASFSSSSEAAYGGWMTSDLLDMMNARDNVCAQKDFFNSTIYTQNGNIYRTGHPDFGCNYSGSGCTGMVQDDLDADQKPVLVSNWNSASGKDNDNESVAVNSQVTCEGSFYYWYRYVPGLNLKIDARLRLFQDDADDDKYVFDYRTPCKMIDGSNVCAMNANLSEMSAANPYFGPLIDNGYAPTETANGGDKKYGNFTSELHTFFRYNGAATLEFTGDDDVWAFVNNKLFVDLGGMRSETNKSSTIKASTCTFQNKDNKTVSLACDPDFDLYEDGLYDLHVFQAERCDFGSNYKLTLDGFLNTGKSTCLAELKTCGNNAIDPGEECDVVNGFVNYAAGFSSIAYGCSAGCKAQFCGDGIVQPERGEECDLASSNSNNGQCSLSCKLPRCGDSVVQIWLGEVCDDGINDGSYGYCGSDCTYLPPRCGDGVVDRSYGEICDDGLNTGAYNTCNPDCTLPAHCGDKIIQEEFESCDDGEENGQPGKCGADCRKSVN